MADAIDPMNSTIRPTPLPGGGLPGPAYARAVLRELDERYEPSWWEVGWRRAAIIIAALLLTSITATGIAAGGRARRARWRLRR
jgi:hypothetical protein